MLNVFRSLVKVEGPDYILSLSTATCEHVNAVTCKWRRGDKYYVAQSFYTQAWLSKVPYPSRVIVTQEGAALRLSDVAIVKEFEDFNACAKFPEITDATLSRAVTKLKQGIENNLAVVLHPLVEGDMFQCEILLSPYPSILMRVMNGSVLLGTIVLVGWSQVVPCIVCDSRLEDYVALLKCAGDSWDTPALMNGGNNCGEE